MFNADFEKKELRLRIRKVEKNLSLESWSKFSNGARVFFEKFEPLVNAESIYLYSPILSKEIDLTGLVKSFPKKNFYLPRIQEDTLEFTPYREPELMDKNKYGILEPLAEKDSEISPVPDLVFVPSMALDMFGGRLGKGKGYYDRFLPKLGKGVKLVGVVPYSQMFFRLPMDEFDYPLDFTVSVNHQGDCRVYSKGEALN